jgi:hypothetical protein
MVEIVGMLDNSGVAFPLCARREVSTQALTLKSSANKTIGFAANSPPRHTTSVELQIPTVFPDSTNLQQMTRKEHTRRHHESPARRVQ